ncbi:MAG: circadian phase modifier CpmA, partial [Deltaproteobacteria bacterium]|nr:circadian phase modifier CpmA [Deltaproteobacteria bacterium]
MNEDKLSPGVLFDHARTARIGLPEAVFCQGKPFSILVDLLMRFGRGQGHSVLFTRLDYEPLDAAQKNGAQYDYDPVSRTAW